MKCEAGPIPSARFHPIPTKDRDCEHEKGGRGGGSFWNDLLLAPESLKHDAFCCRSLHEGSPAVILSILMKWERFTTST